MPITEHYKEQSWDVPVERPTRRPVFKRADGTLWMTLYSNDVDLPQYIEGLAKGWIKYQFDPSTLTMQVLPGKWGYYFIGDKDKKPLRIEIKQPTAQT
jgi:hypothetical protein